MTDYGLSGETTRPNDFRRPPTRSIGRYPARTFHALRKSLGIPERETASFILLAGSALIIPLPVDADIGAGVLAGIGLDGDVRRHLDLHRDIAAAGLGPLLGDE